MSGLGWSSGLRHVRLRIVVVRWSRVWEPEDRQILT